MEHIKSIGFIFENGEKVTIEKKHIGAIKIEDINKSVLANDNQYLERDICNSFLIETLPGTIETTGQDEDDSSHENTGRNLIDKFENNKVESIYIHCNNGNRNGMFASKTYSYFVNQDKLQKLKAMDDGSFSIGTGENYETINIRYTDKELIKLEYIEGKSDWIDLRAAENIKLKAGEAKLISLGVAMEIPDGYEALIVPRSSTLTNFGLIQGNHLGVIDQTYSGNTDIWKFSAYALRDADIKINDRICQFRIIKNQPEVIFNEVDKLEGPDRGGFGVTGRK